MNRIIKILSLCPGTGGTVERVILILDEKYPKMNYFDIDIYFF